MGDTVSKVATTVKDYVVEPASQFVDFFDDTKQRYLQHSDKGTIAALKAMAGAATDKWGSPSKLISGIADIGDQIGVPYMDWVKKGAGMIPEDLGNVSSGDIGMPEAPSAPMKRTAEREERIGGAGTLPPEYRKRPPPSTRKRPRPAPLPSPPQRQSQRPSTRKRRY